MFVFSFVNLRTFFMNLSFRFMRCCCFAAAISAFALMGMQQASHGAVITYRTTMTGPNENPANASPGTGTATVVVDDVLRTMRSFGNFTGLQGTTTNAHIHAPAVAPATAGVATVNPILTTQFPLGVTAGTFDFTLDMTQAGSYNAAYVTANGGTPASAGTALFNSIAVGQAYFNIHTSTFAGGEIRGFLVAVPEPSSMLLSGLAVFGLGVAARYRRKRKIAQV